MWFSSLNFGTQWPHHLRDHGPCLISTASPAVPHVLAVLWTCHACSHLGAFALAIPCALNTQPRHPHGSFTISGICSDVASDPLWTSKPKCYPHTQSLYPAVIFCNTIITVRHVFAYLFSSCLFPSLDFSAMMAGAFYYCVACCVPSFWKSAWY